MCLVSQMSVLKRFSFTIVFVGGRRLGTFQLDAVDKKTVVKVPGARSNVKGRQFMVTVVANGPTRVLQVIDLATHEVAPTTNASPATPDLLAFLIPGWRGRGRGSGGSRREQSRTSWRPQQRSLWQGSGDAAHGWTADAGASSQAAGPPGTASHDIHAALARTDPGSAQAASSGGAMVAGEGQAAVAPVSSLRQGKRPPSSAPPISGEVQLSVAVALAGVGVSVVSGLPY